MWVTDPVVVKHILKDRFNSYSKVEKDEDFLFWGLNSLIGRGIFTATHGPTAPDSGKLWSAHRKCAAGIFSRKNFNDNMGRVFQAKGRELCRILREKISLPVNGDNGKVGALPVNGDNGKVGALPVNGDNGKVDSHHVNGDNGKVDSHHVDGKVGALPVNGDNGKVGALSANGNEKVGSHHVNGDNGKVDAIDMQRMFFAFTMDSIMSIFFGRSSNTMDGAQDTIAHNFDEAHRAMVEHLQTSFIKMVLFDLAPFPFGGIGGALMSLHRRLNPSARTFRKCITRMDEKVMEIIRERRKEPDLEEHSDLLALFMKSKDPSTEKPFTDQDLRNIVLNFTIAGRDTTASTLTWLFYELAIHPEVQERLAAEVLEAFGKESVVTFEAVTKLPYLNGAVYEALRLHPPVPIDFKASREDDVLPDGTVVPKGTKMWFIPFSMGRDPDRYPDPLKFNPDRWIPFTEPSAYEFPQFQAGPRICLGKEMALYEAKLLTVMLIQEFAFSLKEGEAEKITYSNGVTMSLCNSKGQDSHNLWMHVRARP